LLGVDPERLSRLLARVRADVSVLRTFHDNVWRRSVVLDRQPFGVVIATPNGFGSSRHTGTLCQMHN
jgi:hypothetical protein